MGDNFSTDRSWWAGMVQSVMQAMVQAVMRAIGSDGEWQMKLACLPTVHLLLCNLAPNRPRTGTGNRLGTPGLIYV